MTKKKEEDIVCYSCGKKLNDYQDATFVQLKEDGDVYICSECITDTYDKLMAAIHDQNVDDDADDFNDEDMLEDDVDEEPKEELPTPEEIRAHLDKYIIGQEEAKKIISVAAYNHYKMLLYEKVHSENANVEPQKSNVIMVGPSGIGKTEIIRALSKFLNVPLAIADCSSLSKSGYVGADPISVLSDLLYRAGNNIEAAETGIVYLDEFDKLAKRKDDNTAKDVTGEGVQQELLKIIEGSEVEVPISGGRRMNAEMVRLDTSKILFICGGAFDGIEDVIRKRIRSKDNHPAMGFGATSSKSDVRNKEYNDLIVQVTTEDLREFGIIPEMLGRLPIICPLKQLSTDQLVEILTKPKNAIIKQYKEMLKMDNARLVFRKSALMAIAKEAEDRKTGARGLRAIVEKLLTDTMYQVPSMDEPVEVIFTEKCVTDHKKPTIKPLIIDEEKEDKLYAE